ncbi:MAG: C1 family peptidase [Bacteroidales bacterium]|nr:C1 family peptidase [Bacteroidales bacterium]
MMGQMMAQNGGGIDSAMLQKMKNSYQMTPENKALQNAVANFDINKLALNNKQLTAEDTYFSNKVNSKGITDQKSSGRCWLFTGLNVLRAKTIAKHDLADFQFSHNYLFFYDQLEKANLFLQAIIDTRAKPLEDKTVEWLFKNPIGDGGQFSGVSDLVTKYGVVPKEVMPETNSSNNTARMSQLLGWKLREMGLQLREMGTKNTKIDALQAKKTEMLAVIYKMLVLNLGIPPTEFTWTQTDSKGKPINTKTYTPVSFYKEFVGMDISDYVMIMNDPTREYYKIFEIEYDRHTYNGHNWKYLNLPMSDIKNLAIASIKDSTMLYFSCDVAKYLNRDNGTLDLNNYDYSSLFGTPFSMDKKQRIETFASGSSHAMTLCGVDLDENEQPKKWLIENSWGASYGQKGFLIMTDDWFDEYMFRLVVDKKYMPSTLQSLLNQKSVLLPPWDPMFAMEE